jgi:hypothetical protein
MSDAEEMLYEHVRLYMQAYRQVKLNGECDSVKCFQLAFKKQQVVSIDLKLRSASTVLIKCTAVTVVVFFAT